MTAELIERLEQASEGSRELDCEIAVLLDGFFTLPPRWEGGPVGYGYTGKDGVPVHPGHGGDQLVRRYTTSLDAALALAERLGLDPSQVLNDADIQTGLTGWQQGKWRAALCLNACIAILRAKQTTTEGGADGC